MQENLAKPQSQQVNPISSNTFQVNNSILTRLMDEVKNEKLTVGGSYDRTHNRHNRGGQ